LGLSEIGKKGKKGIRKGDGKNNATMLED